jgi:hypothetical protein
VGVPSPGTPRVCAQTTRHRRFGGATEPSLPRSHGTTSVTVQDAAPLERVGEGARGGWTACDAGAGRGDGWLVCHDSGGSGSGQYVVASSVGSSVPRAKDAARGTASAVAAAGLTRVAGRGGTRAGPEGERAEGGARPSD